jgi:hypothetical protein
LPRGDINRAAQYFLTSALYFIEWNKQRDIHLANDLYRYVCSPRNDDITNIIVLRGIEHKKLVEELAMKHIQVTYTVVDNQRPSTSKFVRLINDIRQEMVEPDADLLGLTHEHVQTWWEAVKHDVIQVPRS